MPPARRAAKLKEKNLSCLHERGFSLLTLTVQRTAYCHFRWRPRHWGEDARSISGGNPSAAEEESKRNAVKRSNPQVLPSAAEEAERFLRGILKGA